MPLISAHKARWSRCLGCEQRPVCKRPGVQGGQLSAAGVARSASLRTTKSACTPSGCTCSPVAAAGSTRIGCALGINRIGTHAGPDPTAGGEYARHPGDAGEGQAEQPSLTHRAVLGDVLVIEITRPGSWRKSLA